MKFKRYNIGEGHSSRKYKQLLGVEYFADSHLPVLLWQWEREGRNSSAASYTAAEALTHQRFISEANAEWFIPFLERIANGEIVELGEIQAKHLELFKRPLEEL